MLAKAMYMESLEPPADTTERPPNAAHKQRGSTVANAGVARTVGCLICLGRISTSGLRRRRTPEGYVQPRSCTITTCGMAYPPSRSTTTSCGPKKRCPMSGGPSLGCTGMAPLSKPRQRKLCPQRTVRPHMAPRDTTDSFRSALGLSHRLPPLKGLQLLRLRPSSSARSTDQTGSVWSFPETTQTPDLWR